MTKGADIESCWLGMGQPPFAPFAGSGIVLSAATQGDRRSLEPNPLDPVDGESRLGLHYLEPVAGGPFAR